MKANILPDSTTERKIIIYTIYVEQIKAINEAQLEFEFYAHQLDRFPYIFSSSNRDSLAKWASKMEKYLNTLVEEYEELKIKAGTTESVSVSRLPHLENFVDKNKFSRKFGYRFYRSADLIQDEILEI